MRKTESIWSTAACVLADMIVLDRNLLEIEPTDIRGTQVLTTMVGGRVVYQR